MPDDDVIRVLVVDDHAVVREGLRTFLSLQDGIEVVGEAADGREAVAAAERERPDVVVMDLVMPRLDGVQAMRELRARVPRARVIVLTSFLDDDRLLPAIRAGAAGYLLKNVEPAELARAVRAADAGEALIDPVVAARLVDALADADDHRDEQPLTAREQEVLDLIARGYANKRIALELGHRREDGQDPRGPRAGQARRGRPHPGGAVRHPGRTAVLGPITPTAWTRPHLACRACRTPSSLEHHGGWASPSPARCAIAASASSWTPAAARRSSAPGPVWRASSRSRATSPTPGTAARSPSPRATASTCSSTTPACSARARSRRCATTRSTSCAASTRSTPWPRSRSCRRCGPSWPRARSSSTSPPTRPTEPYAGWGGYGSSKAALEQWTRILAAEHPDWRVYAVDPGDMRTQMHQDAFPGEDISDRSPPEVSVPGLLALIEGDLPSGRYRARELDPVSA